jgi:hypothetical protein
MIVLFWPAGSLAEEAGARWPTADEPAWPTSPYHGARDGDGRIIPCRCRFEGREFRLGEQVCMSSPSGNVMTRCDLIQNNTSWVPTGTACVSSGTRDGRRDVARAR